MTFRNRCSCPNHQANPTTASSRGSTWDFGSVVACRKPGTPPKMGRDAWEWMMFVADVRTPSDSLVLFTTASKTLRRITVLRQLVFLRLATFPLPDYSPVLHAIVVKRNCQCYLKICTYFMRGSLLLQSPLGFPGVFRVGLPDFAARNSWQHSGTSIHHQTYSIHLTNQ